MHSFLFSFSPSSWSFHLPCSSPYFRASCANDAEKVCRQHILQAGRARLHKLVNRAGPLPCQPLIIIRNKNERRRIGERQKWAYCHTLIFCLSVICNPTAYFNPSTYLATKCNNPAISLSFLFLFWQEGKQTLKYENTPPLSGLQPARGLFMPVSGRSGGSLHS